MKINSKTVVDDVRLYNNGDVIVRNHHGSYIVFLFDRLIEDNVVKSYVWWNFSKDWGSETLTRPDSNKMGTGGDCSYATANDARLLLDLIDTKFSLGDELDFPVNLQAKYKKMINDYIDRINNEDQL